MNLPASKFDNLHSELFEIFRSQSSFEEKEFKLRMDLKDFPEGSSMESDQLWSFFYAAKGLEYKAINLFKRSIGYGEARFVQNYLSYLRHTGHIKEFIKETNNASLAIKNGAKHFSRSLINASFLSGDINKMKDVFNLYSQYIEDEKDVLQKDLNSYEFFQKKVKLTNEQMKFLFESYVNIANKYKLTSCQIAIDCYDNENLVLALYTGNKDFKHLALADKELSDTISINVNLHDKIFGVSICSYNQRILLEN